jgi:hypothetical protein
MKHIIAIFALTVMSGCSDNACIDLCQQYELYLDECCYGWSTVFSEEGWVTLDDCYDDHWEANTDRKDECDGEIADVKTLECF